MNKYGKMVLWMGLILMALQLASRWPSVKSIIFSKGSTNTSGGLPPILFPPLGPLLLGNGLPTPKTHRVTPPMVA